MWLTVFDPLLERIRKPRREHDREGVEFTDLLYADDYSLDLTAETEEEVRRAAHINVQILREVLRSMSLELSEEKCRNILFNPWLLPRGIYRRQIAS